MRTYICSARFAQAYTTKGKKLPGSINLQAAASGLSSIRKARGVPRLSALSTAAFTVMLLSKHFCLL